VANEAVELAVDEDTDSGLGEGTRISLESLEDVIEELRQGRIAAWGDLPSRGKALEMLYTEGIRSYISMPLMVRGELVGALNFGMTEPTALSQEQEELARQVANQLAIAIHQARLYEQVQRHSEELEQRVADRTQELSVLYEVAALASQSLELETTLARSLEQVLRAMRSEIGAIHLLSEAEGTAVDETSAGEVFRLAVQQGIPPDLATEMESLPADAELARSVAELDRPLVVAGITSDPRVFATLPSMMLRARPIEPHTYVGMPLRASGRALGILSVARRTEQPEHSVEELSLLISIADQLGVVVESNRLRKQAEQAAVLEERERLARDLHDSVTQLLYTVSLFATTGKGALGSGDQELLEHALSQLENAAQQALKEMRLMLYELRPPVLAQLGLVRALRRRLESVEGRVGVDARLLTGKGVELPMQVEQELYLIALEALNNGLKYSNATSVTVDIDAGEEQVELKVIDNGVGFDLDAVEADGGLGLTNMRQRAERLGGVLRIVSAPGAGTQVVATVPYGD
jgi:signal transduction histidine kinase